MENVHDVLRDGAGAALEGEGGVRRFVTQHTEEATTAALALVATSVPAPAGPVLGAVMALASVLIAAFGKLGHRSREIARLADDRKRVARKLGVSSRDLAWLVGRALWGPGVLASWQTQGPEADEWPDGSSGRVQGINGKCGRGITCELRMLKQAKSALALLEQRADAFGGRPVREELGFMSHYEDGQSLVTDPYVTETLAAWGDGAVPQLGDEVEQNPVAARLASVARRLFGSGDARAVELAADDVWRALGSFVPLPDNVQDVVAFAERLRDTPVDGQSALSLLMPMDAVEGPNYGFKWGDTRPPGLRSNVRRAGAQGAALPAVALLAWLTALFLGVRNVGAYVRTMCLLALNESGATFGLPAHTYNDLPERQRGGASRITAWGCFQFNLGAWQRVSRPLAYLGEDESAMALAEWLEDSTDVSRILPQWMGGPGLVAVPPDHRDASPLVELLVPLVHYANVFRVGENTHGNGPFAVWLMHNGPAYLTAWLQERDPDAFEAAEADAQRQQTRADQDARRQGHQQAREKAERKTHPDHMASVPEGGNALLGVLWSVYNAKGEEA